MENMTSDQARILLIVLTIGIPIILMVMFYDVLTASENKRKNDAFFQSIGVIVEPYFDVGKHLIGLNNPNFSTECVITLDSMIFITYKIKLISVVPYREFRVIKEIKRDKIKEISINLSSNIISSGSLSALGDNVIVPTVHINEHVIKYFLIISYLNENNLEGTIVFEIKDVNETNRIINILNKYFNIKNNIVR